MLIPRENLQASGDYLLNLLVNATGIWKLISRVNTTLPHPPLSSSISNHHIILTLCGAVKTLAYGINIIIFEICCRELSRAMAKILTAVQ